MTASGAGGKAPPTLNPTGAAFEHLSYRLPSALQGYGPKKFKGTVVATGEVEGEQYWTIK